MGWRHSCGRRHQCPTADTIDPTLYTQTRAHVVITDTPPRSTGTATRNTGTASTEDRNDDAADARRRAQPGRATVIGGHDEFTACRRRWSKAFRIALGNAPAEGFAQQISGEQTRCRMFFFSAAYQELSFGNTGAVFLSVADIHNLTDKNSFLDRLHRAEMTLKVTQGHWE